MTARPLTVDRPASFVLLLARSADSQLQSCRALYCAAAPPDRQRAHLLDASDLLCTNNVLYDSLLILETVRMAQVTTSARLPSIDITQPPGELLSSLNPAFLDEETERQASECATVFTTHNNAQRI